MSSGVQLRARQFEQREREGIERRGKMIHVRDGNRRRRDAAPKLLNPGASKKQP
jgi:hypothetical protein